MCFFSFVLVDKYTHKGCLSATLPCYLCGYTECYKLLIFQQMLCVCFFCICFCKVSHFCILRSYGWKVLLYINWFITSCLCFNKYCLYCGCAYIWFLITTTEWETCSLDVTYKNPLCFNRRYSFVFANTLTIRIIMCTYWKIVSERWSHLSVYTGNISVPFT
jgi:hypothetical protein